MKTTCGRCGGYVIGERDLDYYRARHWRCINCGWCREESVAFQSRAVPLSERSSY